MFVYIDSHQKLLAVVAESSSLPLIRENVGLMGKQEAYDDAIFLLATRWLPYGISKKSKEKGHTRWKMQKRDQRD